MHATVDGRQSPELAGVAFDDLLTDRAEGGSGGVSEQWPAEGDLLNGRYRLIEPIGSGGMAVVWRARDESLERLVAVKVLNTELAVDQRIRELVRREARTAAQLTHPQSTPVYDYGESATPSGGPCTFVVMQLLEGEGLDERLSAGPLPWKDAVRIGEQVARVLAATHGRGYIHGDISPGNVVLTADGVRIIDFGLAETLVEAGRTGLGGIFGTPPYVAPERLTGQPSQLASDVYAVGALLFEMFTGRPPHAVVTWADATEARLSAPPPSLTGVPDLPDDVADLCLRCLDPDPAERPAASEVAEELAAALAAAEPPIRPTKRVRRRFPRTWTLVALTVAVLTGVVVNCWPELTGTNHAQHAPGPGATGQDPAAGAGGIGDGEGPIQSGAGPATPTESVGPATPDTVPPGTETVSVDAALSAVFGVINHGAAEATIKAGTAEMLRVEVRNLTANRSGDIDTTMRAIENLRRKVSDGTREGSIAASAARELSAALDTLTTAVRAEPQRR
jgi:serine/threonine-protein kinase